MDTIKYAEECSAKLYELGWKHAYSQNPQSELFIKRIEIIKHFIDEAIEANRAETLVSLQGELLPCPFCGGEAELGSLGGDGENWAIFCKNKKCQIPVCEMGVQAETKQEIINLWNKRART